MKIREFVDTYTIEQFIEHFEDTYKYIPVQNKHELAQNILGHSTIIDEGIVTIDPLKKEVYLAATMLAAYWELEFADNFEQLLEEYDMLCSAGWLDAFVEVFPSEYSRMVQILSQQEKIVVRQNSMEMQIVQFVNRLSGVIDGLSDKLGGIMDNLDLEGLGLDNSELMGLLGR